MGVHVHRYKPTEYKIVGEWSKGNWPEQCRLKIEGTLAQCRCTSAAIIPDNPDYRMVEIGPTPPE